MKLFNINTSMMLEIDYEVNLPLNFEFKREYIYLIFDKDLSKSSFFFNKLLVIFIRIEVIH